MAHIKKLALIHAALVVLMAGCMFAAQRPEMEVFYFLAGMLCMPVFGSMRDLFCAITQRKHNGF